LFLFLFRLLARLPLRGLHVLGSVLGGVVLWVSPSYRRTQRANLVQAQITDPKAPRRAAAAMGQGVLELPYVWLRPATDILLRTSTTGWDAVEAARARGRGIIFLTPHLGCFEVTAQFFSLHVPNQAPLTVLYRQPRKSALRPLIETGRARSNLKPAPADLAGVRQLLRALKRGEAIGLLPDQVPSHGEGVWASFFGRPAYTMTLPAKLHQLTGATILLAYGERLHKGQGWVVRFFPFDDELTGTPEQQATQINQAMERLIRLAPEQYLWGYNRYKVPNGVTPPQAEL
jgi:KDO2-lipid IV(A) lauroyltransferase